MAVATIRRKNETSEKLISRLQKKVQNARVVVQLKKEKYHRRRASRSKQKLVALKREFFRAQRKKMQYY